MSSRCIGDDSSRLVDLRSGCVCVGDHSQGTDERVRALQGILNAENEDADAVNGPHRKAGNLSSSDITTSRRRKSWEIAVMDFIFAFVHFIAFG